MDPTGPSTDNTRHLKDLVAGFDVGMLITIDGDDIHARPMAIADVTEDGRITFATGRSTHKTVEIERDDRVAISFQSRDKYLFVLGTADVHQDRARIDQLWKEMWRVWFPNGKDDPDLCILEVFPAEAELWDMTGTKGVRYLVEAAKAVVKGERLDENREPPGTHEHVVVP
jgi:general stress protein 26